MVQLMAKASTIKRAISGQSTVGAGLDDSAGGGFVTSASISSSFLMFVHAVCTSVFQRVLKW
jgi:hypothetical protein